MDPNQNQNNTQPNTNPAPQTVPPVQAPMAPAGTEPPIKRNNKMVLYIITVAVLILIAGFLYIIFGNLNKSAQPVVTETPTIVPSPTTGVVSDETEIDNIIVDDPESDFSDVDKDLQSL